MSQCIPINIIGLSRNDCNCPQYANKPTETAISNYYIDQLVNIENHAFGDCGTGSIWDKMQDARQRAIDDILSDFSAVLYQRFMLSSKPFFDEIGLRSIQSLNYQAQNVCGARIDSFGEKGSSFYLKDLSIGVSIGGNSTLKIWKGYSSNGQTVTNVEQIYTESIILSSNVFTPIVLTTPIEFIISDNVHYFITYNLPTNSKPFNNIFPNCDCYKVDMSWRKTVNVRGFSLIDDTELSLKNASLSDNGCGIILKPRIFCDLSLYFCKIVSYGFDNLDYFRPLAVAIQYKAAANLLSDLKLTNSINFVTLTAKESIDDRTNKYLNEYGLRLNHLAKLFPDEDFTCLRCSSKNYFSKGSIST